MLTEKELFDRYSYYYDGIKNIWSFAHQKNVTLNDLNLPKGMKKRAYTEIKEMGFEGTLMEYLSWISSNMILYFFKLEVYLNNGKEKIPPKRIKRIVERYLADAYNFCLIIGNNEKLTNSLLDDYEFKDKVELLYYVVDYTFDRKIEKGWINKMTSFYKNK